MARAHLARLGLALTLVACSSDDEPPEEEPVPPWTPAFPGHRSFETLTTSNGIAVATVRNRPASAGQAFNLVDRLADHIYASYDEETDSKDFLRSLYFGLRVDGQASWLLNVEAEAAYVPGTNVIHLAQSHGDLQVDSYVFAPFHDPSADEAQAHLLVALMKVENGGAPANVDGLALVDLDLAMFGDPKREAVAWASPDVVTETNGADRFVVRNLTSAGASATAGPPTTDDSPLQRVGRGQPFETGPVETEPKSNHEVGLAAPIGALEGGDTGWFGLVIGYGAGEDRATLEGRIDAWVNGRSPQDILQAELDWWEAWHAKETVPPGLHLFEALLWRQSTAILKMGQLREPGRGHGQILASLVPGAWRISWVRDAAYAIMGLSRAGHFEEARLGLEFMLNAEMRKDGDRNFYDVNFIERDLGVTLSANYAISVTRYFGNGTEESDSNAAGPNIEFDNWGLFLWALGDYVERSGDTTLLDAHWPKISTQVADLLIELVEPQTGLLHADSSIWERHWNAFGSPEPETRKRYAYSSICAYEGLKRAARLADRVGDADRAAAYSAASEGLKAAVLEHLVVTPSATGQPTLAGNLEELEAGHAEVRYMDQAVVEAINTGLLDAHPEIAAGTIAAFDAYLAIGGHSPGYFRNDDGTVYDQAEWVMIDLRTASAMLAIGQTERAHQILDWVTDQARHNYGLIPELFGRADGDYNSNTPMCGFGPGAYLMALEERQRASD